MNAAIVENNIIVNVIVLPEGANPADYGAYPVPEGKWIGDEYDDTSTRIKTLESENTLLKAQLQATSDRSDFIEDCIAEMAAEVYV